MLVFRAAHPRLALRRVRRSAVHIVTAIRNRTTSVPSPNYIDIILAPDVERDAYLSACFDCGTSSTFCAPCRPQPPRVLSRQFGDGTLGRRAAEGYYTDRVEVRPASFAQSEHGIAIEVVAATDADSLLFALQLNQQLRHGRLAHLGIIDLVDRIDREVGVDPHQYSRYLADRGVPGLASRAIRRPIQRRLGIVLGPHGGNDRYQAAPRGGVFKLIHHVNSRLRILHGQHRDNRLIGTETLSGWQILDERHRGFKVLHGELPGHAVHEIGIDRVVPVPRQPRLRRSRRHPRRCAGKATKEVGPGSSGQVVAVRTRRLQVPLRPTLGQGRPTMPGNLSIFAGKPVRRRLRIRIRPSVDQRVDRHGPRRSRHLVDQPRRTRRIARRHALDQHHQARQAFHHVRLVEDGCQFRPGIGQRQRWAGKTLEVLHRADHRIAVFGVGKVAGDERTREFGVETGYRRHRHRDQPFAVWVVAQQRRIVLENLGIRIQREPHHPVSHAAELWVLACGPDCVGALGGEPRSHCPADSAVPRLAGLLQRGQ